MTEEVAGEGNTRFIGAYQPYNHLFFQISKINSSITSFSLTASNMILYTIAHAIIFFVPRLPLHFCRSLPAAVQRNCTWYNAVCACLLVTPHSHNTNTGTARLPYMEEPATRGFGRTSYYYFENVTLSLYVRYGIYRFLYDERILVRIMESAGVSRLEWSRRFGTEPVLENVNMGRSLVSVVRLSIVGMVMEVCIRKSKSVTYYNTATYPNSHDINFIIIPS
ncbi:hypothetical protein B0O99DRAFT_329371 [Bisporella sp. PMI_857]|nr:hypothetical protein B0O99DRAFT_363455 [Bisporella sp. PMI_857]KAH8600578.1 hypothetical protein B0O99DRAFT_329371 [Bisporella sp. PMI_857]